MIPFNIDSAFWIGSTHKVCQDYAYHSYNRSNAIIADGCSSSPNTDCGARFLTLAAKEYIEGAGNINGEVNGNAIIASAASIQKLSGLSKYCLDSTLLTMSLITDETYRVNVFGDGLVVKMNHDNSFMVYDVEYDSGAPFYLSYYLSTDRLAGYKKEFGEFNHVNEYFVNTDGSQGFFTSQLIGVEEYPSWVFEKKSCKAVFIMSDGIKSFSKKVKTDTSITQESIPAREAIYNLLQFKGFQGEFIQRRVQRFKKFCQENQWQNSDDVSIAGIYMGD